MALINDTYFQLCEKIITKEQGNNHFNSSRHWHKEIIGYWPAYFPQRRLNRDEDSIFEKNFWETIFGSEQKLTVYGFLKTYIMTVKIIKNHITDNDDYNDIG